MHSQANTAKLLEDSPTLNGRPKPSTRLFQLRIKIGRFPADTALAMRVVGAVNTGQSVTHSRP